MCPRSPSIAGKHGRYKYITNFEFEYRMHSIMEVSCSEDVLYAHKFGNLLSHTHTKVYAVHTHACIYNMNVEPHGSHHSHYRQWPAKPKLSGIQIKPHITYNWPPLLHPICSKVALNRDGVTRIISSEQSHVYNWTIIFRNRIFYMHTTRVEWNELSKHTNKHENFQVTRHVLFLWCSYNTFECKTNVGLSPNTDRVDISESELRQIVGSRIQRL